MTKLMVLLKPNVEYPSQKQSFDMLQSLPIICIERCIEKNVHSEGTINDRLLKRIKTHLRELKIQLSFQLEIQMFIQIVQ